MPGEVLADLKKSLDTKILFTDLDDTLLNSEKEISERARSSHNPRPTKTLRNAPS